MLATASVDTEAMDRAEADEVDDKAMRRVVDDDDGIHADVTVNVESRNKQALDSLMMNVQVQDE